VHTEILENEEDCDMMVKEEVVRMMYRGRELLMWQISLVGCRNYSVKVRDTGPSGRWFAKARL